MSMRYRLYELLNGNGSASLKYSRVMTVLIVASLLPICFKETNIAFIVIEYVCVSVFVIDYLARWVTADLSLRKGALSFVLYPFSPMAIIDLLSILPAFLALNNAFRTLRVVRLFRALRAFKLIRYSKSATAITAVFVKQRQSLIVVLTLAIAYILVSAVVIFNVEPDTFDDFLDAIYWAVVSLTTVGYGDLYPTSDIGRIIAMLSSLAGIAVVALPSGIITAGFLEELEARQADRWTEDSNKPSGREE